MYPSGRATNVTACTMNALPLSHQWRHVTIRAFYFRHFTFASCKPRTASFLRSEVKRKFVLSSSTARRRNVMHIFPLKNKLLSSPSLISPFGRNFLEFISRSKSLWQQKIRPKDCLLLPPPLSPPRKKCHAYFLSRKPLISVFLSFLLSVSSHISNFLRVNH